MKRIIPKDLNYAKDDVMDFTWSNDWILRGKYEAEPENFKPFELRWLKDDGQTGLHYVEDFIVGFPYYVMKGVSEEIESEKIADAIEIYSLEEILKLLDESSTPESRAKAILYLGVSITGEFRDDLFSEFLKVFSDQDPKVRMAAVKACTYIGWREFREVIDRIRVNDSDEEVRLKAKATLDAFDDANPKESLG